MLNKDMPAMPMDKASEDAADEGFWPAFTGLTKREHFAAIAMQGFISAGSNGMPDADTVASLSVEYANALLKALETNDED